MTSGSASGRTARPCPSDRVADTGLGQAPPGGWWLLTEPDIEFGRHDILRPDIAGWRRDRTPKAPEGFPVRVVPDWVCEVLSPSTAWRDLGEKRRIYHQAGVGHYWVVHPTDRVISVFAWNEANYGLVASCGIVGRVRLPPFEAVEFEAARLFGLEPAEETEG